MIYDNPNIGGDCYGMNINSFGCGTYVCGFPGRYQCRGKIVPQIVNDEHLACPPPIFFVGLHSLVLLGTGFQCEGIGSGESGWMIHAG